MMAIFRKIVFKILHLYNKEKAAKYIGVKFGQNCRLITNNYGTEPWLIEIGDNVTITSGVKLLTHDGSTWLARDEKGRRFKYGKIIIGNNVFIGVNSIILPDVTIGNNVIIGAGAVVTKSVESNAVVVGNPAKKIKNYEDVITDYIKNCKSEADFNRTKNYKENILQIINSH